MNRAAKDFMMEGILRRSPERYQLITLIEEYLRPSTKGDLNWSITYGSYWSTNGLIELDVPTLRKIVQIMEKAAQGTGNRALQKNGNDFLPDICAGRFHSKQQGKTLINSLHHFLYLVDEYPAINVWHVSRMIRGLPHNKQRILSSITPARREVSTALLKFMAHAYHASVDSGRYPEELASSVNYITIKSPELCRFIEQHGKDIDRINELYFQQGITDSELILECLDTHSSLASGAL